MGEHRRKRFESGSFVIRWLINAAAVWVAMQIVPGVEPIGEGALPLIITAAIFGLVNALIRPLVLFLTCPLLILTLGLGTLLVNAGMFALAGWIGQQFGVGYTVGGIVPALLGALVTGAVSLVLSALLGERDRDHA